MKPTIEQAREGVIRAEKAWAECNCLGRKCREYIGARLERAVARLERAEGGK